ncbi:olfactory receptor 6F1-like [Microcaecilia unicolor]|uniref:Olfactory receptor 6F1-like n=1 Tax=Microcaecilia unicolor TaxID=1415580 RepID=A0A6P7WGQ2_9AMPH|nr:olfactory receptor 6F1-like [Microcaecilia unicolor]
MAVFTDLSRQQNMSNQTHVKEFFLVGLPVLPELQILVFWMFLLMYIITISVNLVLITIVRMSRHLHRPMYFFLCNLSFLEIGYVSVTVPRILFSLLTHKKNISFEGCFFQVFFFTFLCATETVLLGIMSFDRYVAICHPLRYAIIMSCRVCLQLIITTWAFAFLATSFPIILISKLPFCGPNVIDHFFCECSPLLKLVCGNANFGDLAVTVCAAVTILCSVMVTLLSYIFIITSILQMSSSTGNQKAFSTCASHLTVVIIFYSTILAMYIKPTARDAHQNKVMAVLKSFYQKMNNQTYVKEFLIVGLPSLPELQILVFWIFLLMYIVTICVNLVLITIVRISHHLHRPMYFFLSNLSFLEMGYVSVTVPRALNSIMTHRTNISFEGCFLQLFFFTFLGATENILLGLMSFDRYVAICYPLRYSTIMSSRVCLQLMIATWFTAFVTTASPIILISKLPFCGPNVIDHFFCECSPLLKLVCGNAYFGDLVVTVCASVVILCSVIVTVVSYVHIIATVLKMSAATGKQKAFSTCASHLTVVIIFYTTLLAMYIKPTARDARQNKVMAVLYAVVTPLLNPFIYSLKNKEVKEAIYQYFTKKRIY